MSLDNVESTSALSLNTPTGDVCLGEMVLVLGDVGESAESKGVLKAIGTPFSKVGGETVRSSKIRKIVEEDNILPIKCHYIDICYSDLLQDSHTREGELLISTSWREGMTKEEVVAGLLEDCDAHMGTLDMWEAIDHNKGILEQAIVEAFSGFSPSPLTVEPEDEEESEEGTDVYVYAYLAFEPKSEENS